LARRFAAQWPLRMPPGNKPATEALAAGWAMYIRTLGPPFPHGHAWPFAQSRPPSPLLDGQRYTRPSRTRSRDKRPGRANAHRRPDRPSCQGHRSQHEPGNLERLRCRQGLYRQFSPEASHMVSGCGLAMHAGAHDSHGERLRSRQAGVVLRACCGRPCARGDPTTTSGLALRRRRPLRRAVADCFADRAAARSSQVAGASASTAVSVAGHALPTQARVCVGSALAAAISSPTTAPADAPAGVLFCGSDQRRLGHAYAGGLGCRYTRQLLPLVGGMHVRNYRTAA